MSKTTTEILCDNCPNRNKDCSLWNNDKCFEMAEAILFKPKLKTTQQGGECMDEFEKETLRFFEDVVSYGTENHVSISVDSTIIEYFKVAINAIRKN